jgi:tRNA G18 (ribose-2'-O)-methylase SpoU
VRPAPAPVESLLPAQTLVVLPEVRNVENLGLIIRTAHGLGVDGLLLSGKGCDPYARRVIRVSVGSVFGLPIARSADLGADLCRLKDEHGFTLIAAVADADATPIHTFRRTGDQGVAVVFGNEPDGLSDVWAGLCNARVTIPMKPGVDSLNLAVAAGIILHRITSANAR